MYWNRDSHGVMSHTSEKQRFEFFAPPGKYELMAYGSEEGASTKHLHPKVEVKPGQTELDMGVIDLPATKVSSLIGKPAPELGPIKEWKNGSPVTLADLRGKLVVLHFGGGYPSTSRDLPRLLELHEEFENAGVVIIALYNCESMEQLEQRFKEVTEKYGGEPEVPFRIAVDGGEARPIEETDRTIPGATYAAYEITAYTTTVLIDREGKIVEVLNLYGAKKKFETMLGASVKPELATWRQRFNKVYFLEEGRVLKRIPPPFIPERQEYYKSEHSHQASLIERGPDYFTFHWDGELRNWGMGFGDGKRPLRSVLNGNLNLKQNEYEGPKELLELDVPGDWIVRKDASQEQKLTALEGILANEIGPTIRFVKRTVERKAIVAAGSFWYSRLPAAQDDRGVLMFCGDFVEEDGGGGGTADSVHELLGAIGDRVNMPVIDQTEPAEPMRIPYRHYRSS
jgi:peroxiredoxin